MVAFILVGSNLLAAYPSYAAARRRSVRTRLWLGLIFGPFAWIAVLLVPARQNEATI